MKGVFPIKQNRECIYVLFDLIIVYILIETELDSSPFRDLRIIVFANGPENLLSERRKSKVGIGAEYLSKGPLTFMPFYVKGAES